MIVNEDLEKDYYPWCLIMIIVLHFIYLISTYTLKMFIMNVKIDVKEEVEVSYYTIAIVVTSLFLTFFELITICTSNNEWKES